MKALINTARWGFLIGLACLLNVTCARNTDHYDILVTNTKIVDGTGQAAYRGSVGIKGEKIAAVGKIRGTAETVIDGSNLVTSPGFVDAHTHADNNIFDYPLAENFIMQGVTTVVTGNCGGSPAPRKDLTFAGYLSKLEELGVAPNVAQLVGHIGIRVQVMGGELKREATPKEVEEMMVYVEEAMQSGAFGLSTFMDPPSSGEYASVENELIPLVKVAAKYGCGFWPHKRHHRSQWYTTDLEEMGYGIFHGPAEDAFVGTYRGLMEAIDICRKAHCPLHIGHLVNAYRMPQPHPSFLDEAAAKATLSLIDEAIAEGMDITFDVTFAPYGVARRGYLLRDFWRSRNIALRWMNQWEKEEVIAKLKTEEVREKIREVHRIGRLKLGMIQTKSDPYWMDRFKILTCANKGYEGKTVSEIAGMMSVDPLDALILLLEVDPDTVWVQHLDERYFEAALPVFLKHPNASPNTDWTCAPAGPPEGFYEGKDMWDTTSPIAYGLFADYIAKLVRDNAQLTLEEAVNRATFVPAKKALGLDDRGVLAPGAYADVLVFDPNTIRMTGDFLKPAQRPDGIEYVIINGQIVYKDKAHTGARPGKVLRHKT
jgi:N-acyl-D-amino-acid deacylase